MSLENHGVIDDPRSPEEKSKDHIAGAETTIKIEDLVFLILTR